MRDRTLGAVGTRSEWTTAAAVTLSLVDPTTWFAADGVFG